MENKKLKQFSIANAWTLRDRTKWLALSFSEVQSQFKEIHTNKILLYHLNPTLLPFLLGREGGCDDVTSTLKDLLPLVQRGMLNHALYEKDRSSASASHISHSFRFSM